MNGVIQGAQKTGNSLWQAWNSPQVGNTINAIGKGIGGLAGGLGNILGGIENNAVQSFGLGKAQPQQRSPIQPTQSQQPTSAFQQALSQPKQIQTKPTIPPLPNRGTPTNNSAVNYQPNITIPYSQTGQPYRLPPQIAQPIMNAFNNIHQATPAAQVLNHPVENSVVTGRPNYGENAGFKTNNIDVPNNDGSIDRGLFRINSNTFNGIMADPHWGPLARQKFGINNWEDMNDPQKNAFMAKLIYERQGWGAWFAAPQHLRAQGAPNLGALSQLLQQNQQK